MKNKLHENQLYLLRHLARFQMLSYPDCLELLDTEGTKDRTVLSYVFRPLTKNKYVSKQRDGGVSILAKGRALFPGLTPLISTGGGAAERRRVMEVSHMAALMERSGVPAVGERIDAEHPYFIPSACWRKIVPGILSTTRFAGMLMAGEERLAVYDIGDGCIEWQGRAEGSLFHPRYGSYEVQATGMLLICRDGLRNSVAEQIIRYTMWQRRQLLHDRLPTQRERPVRWSRAPIRLRKLYGRVYLTTPSRFRRDLERILTVPGEIRARCGDDGIPLHDPAQGDYERGNYRGFVCYAADLLKYVYFFSAVRALMRMLDDPGTQPPALRYEIYIHEGDEGLLALYPDCLDLEGLNIYVYQPKEDPAGH